MTNLTSLLLAAIAALTLSGCATPQSSNYQWSFSVVAPEHYKVWVEHLEFEKSDERHWRMPMGNVGCCWKGPDGPSGSGGLMSPFPDYIGIQWFSFAEQKYYQRLISLPEGLEEQMREPAPYSGSTGLSERPRYTLAIGLAPGGKIVLWIMNQIGNEMEVARLQANEIEGDAEKYKAGTRDYLEKNGPYLEKHGIPKEGW